MVLVLVKLPKGEMFISTNELHLSLVIESLFDNTNKFTDSGSVTLKIKLDKAQSKLRIEVTDTGCGIPPEEREEIFLCLSVSLSVCLLQCHAFVSILPGNNSLHNLKVHLFLCHEEYCPLNALIKSYHFFQEMPDSLVRLERP